VAKIRGTYRILLIALSVSLIILVCHAKNYSECFEPYEVDFIVSNTSTSAHYSPTEDPSDRTAIDAYTFNFNIPGTNQEWGKLEIVHFYKTIKLELDEVAETMKKSKGYSCNSSHRVIDGHDGVVVYCFGAEPCNRYYEFEFQLNNQTTVYGTVYLDWYTPMQSFLDSLHIREIGSSNISNSTYPDALLVLKTPAIVLV
jgi:hypothetical protein